MDYIKADKKEYPFLFSWAAYKEFVLADSSKDDEWGLHEKGIYLGFVYGAKREKKKCISFDEFLELIDDYPDLHEEASKLFYKGFSNQKKISSVMTAARVVD